MLKLFLLSAVMTLAFASAAFADTVTNLLDNTPGSPQFEEIRINEGETRNVPFRVLAGSEKYPPESDGEEGCNVDAGEALELGFGTTDANVAREDPKGSRIIFQDGPDSGTTACGPDPNASTNPPAAAPDDRSITVRGVSRGTANISTAQPPVRNTTGKGSYAYGPATFKVIVQNVAPTANNNSYNTNEDNVLTVNAPGVLGNDTDPGNNPLTAVLVNPPQNGTLKLNADGSFTYTPNANFSGTDTFTYRASDGQAESAPATVSVNVAAVNDAPDAAADTAATDEDQLAVLNVLDNDTDADGDPLTVTSTTRPANGTVSCARVGVCTYVPNPNFNGVDSYTYTVSDGKGGTDTATVTVSVGAANDAPNAVGNDYAVPEDGALNVAAPGVLGNDTDLENDALTARLDRGPGNGTLTLNLDGSFTYTPNANYNGPDSFTYRACDNGTPELCSEPATVEIAVDPVNDPPVARGTTATVDEDGQVRVNAVANDSDADGDPLTVTGFTQPQNGTVDCTPQGTCTYTPNADFNGQDSFTYTVSDGVSDGNGGTATATIDLTVRPVNDAPRAQNDSYIATEEQPLKVDAPGVLGNDLDTENDRLRTFLESGPSNGTLTLNPDGSFVYVPNADFEGRDSFTYRANDDLDSSNVATVTIEVAGVNDPASARPDQKNIAEDGTLNFPSSDLTQNDSAGPGEGGQPLTVTQVGDPQNCTVRLENGRVIFEPAPNYNGPASFTYTVCDGGEPRECATATVNVDVGAVNDAPVARADEASVPEDGSVKVNVLENDTDPEGKDDIAPASVRVVEGPSNGTAAVDPQTGEITYAPTPNFDGADSFVYEVCDRQGACSRATVGVTVGAANDAPVARDDRGSTGAAAVVANAYISQYASSKAASPTRLFRPDTSSRPYTFGKIGNDIARPMNAIGYRSTDGMLYGYRMVNSPGIVRVDPSTGAVRFLGNPRGLPAASNYIAGDVSPNGSTYYLYGQGSDILRVVDLRAFRARSVQLSLRVSVADLAVSPVNGRLYGVDGSGRLLEVDPGTGRVTTKSVPSLKPGGYGAVWFTADGDFIAYENGKASTRTNGTLYQVRNPIAAPEVITAEAGPYTVGNDGAAFVAPANPAGLSVAVNVLANDGDVDGPLDPGTLRVIEQPAHGTARINPDRTITYTTDATYGGTDSFRYEVCDREPAPQCAAATVSITAAPVPDDGTPVDAPLNATSTRRE